jgi:hypothetical protein
LKIVKIVSIVVLITIAGCGGTIDVTVKKSTGGPVSSMAVNLTGEGNTLVGNTDIKGKVSFDDLEYGKYTISTAATTSYSAATTKVDISLFSGTKNAEITVGIIK